MQKTEYPQNHNYAQRGIDRSNYGWTDAYKTQYGHTSLYCRLELHVGDHLYRKRGGSSEAFLPDKFDYRYESLAMSLGVLEEQAMIKGAYLGNYYGETEDGNIRFRISEESPTDLIIVWEYDPETYEKILQLKPTAITIAQDLKWFQAVFSLARENQSGPSDEFADGYYDEEPDSVDAYEYHWAPDLPESKIIDLRLHVCGF